MKTLHNRMVRIVFSSVILTIATASSLFAQERYLKPADEAPLDPSFLAFRTKLIAAAERRDTQFVLSVLDPKIKLSFGGDEGIADFKRLWKINSKTSKFWSEFLRVIKNGGTFVRENGKRTDLFYAPYTFGSFPEDLEPYELAVVFGSDVALRKEPSTSSEVLARLSYNILRIQYELVPKSGRSEYPGWWLVRSLGGLEGYIKKEFVRSPIDYRAGFDKKGGRWKMVTFVSGD